jgi:hypothetical protein
VSERVRERVTGTGVTLARPHVMWWGRSEREHQEKVLHVNMRFFPNIMFGKNLVLT